MPLIRPISQRELIRYLKQCGFEGPYSGGKHPYMEKGSQRVRIPNPHKADISKGLLLEVLRKANITREEWENL